MIKSRDRNTKIIATLGPSSSTFEMIESLFLSGVDVFRLNFSHGDHAGHLQNLHFIQDVEKKYNRPIGVLADLQGPKIRIGVIENGPVTLKSSDLFELHLHPVRGTEKAVQLSHPEIFNVAEKGTSLLLDDGKIKLTVLKNKENILTCEVIVGGPLSSRKGVNVPNIQLPLSAMTDKDRKDLAFVLTQDIPWIALSFVQTPHDIEEARALIGTKAKIIAKLEKPMALRHLDAIVNASDAIMVARGDLGVELPLEEVPSLQKRIIRSCRSVGKPVIVATQMLESMIEAPSPTRAEASDVANAIYDHVDAVMLSAESASGHYPKEAVQMMHRILLHTEKDSQSDYKVLKQATHKSISDAITAAAREITQHLNIRAIITLTHSGSTAYAAAKERPYAPIIGCTQNKQTARELCLCWGVYSLIVPHDAVNVDPISYAKEHHFVHKHDQVIMTSGIPFEKGSTNFLKIVNVD